MSQTLTEHLLGTKHYIGFVRIHNTRALIHHKTYIQKTSDSPRKLLSLQMPTITALCWTFLTISIQILNKPDKTQEIPKDLI